MSPSVSESQRRLMAIAKSIKEGKTSPKYSKTGANLANTMSMGDLRDFARTPKRNLPMKKNKNNRKSTMPPMQKGALPK